MKKSLFILAGNAAYLNRGCEAIVRGTVDIISRYFKDPQFIALSNFNCEETYNNQCKFEIDNRIRHKKTRKLYYSQQPVVNKLLWRAYKMFYASSIDWMHGDIKPVIEQASAVLSIGGDNYSLDYGALESYMMLDDYVNQNKKKLIIWGASIGPFSCNPKIESVMASHLRKQAGIFVRETASLEYLKTIGVTENVQLVGDPAFIMKPQEPYNKEFFAGIDLRSSIGLNLSPLIAKYINSSGKNSDYSFLKNVVYSIAKRYPYTILLIPHVTAEDPGEDDYVLLKNIADDLNVEKIRVLAPIYSAPELKWIISKLLVFAGARTHATIAGLSSLVPTISFAYSLKAKGINQDIFEDLSYCIDPKDFNAEKICLTLDKAIDQNLQIRDLLSNKIPIIQERSYKAGEFLSQICQDTVQV